MVLLAPVEANWLAVAGDFVYVADTQFGIVRVSKTGASPTLVTPTVGMQIGPFVIDDANIYFLTADDDVNGSLYSVPRAGGAPKQLATMLPAPIALTQDADAIYWINLGTLAGENLSADGGVVRIKKDGSGRQVLADHLNAPFDIAVDSSDVYFVESGLANGPISSGVRRVPKLGGATTSLVETDVALAVTTSNSDVYYSSLGAVTTSVSRVSKSGGTPEVVIPDLLAFALVVFDETLYAAGLDENSNTFIVSIPTAGGGIKTVSSASLDTAAMAFDDCAVYYAAEARLERAPR